MSLERTLESMADNIDNMVKKDVTVTSLKKK